jgi:uncharacterized protein (TIGR01777 family)
MRVFVTGGTGLVGQHIVARLRERGDDVLVLSRATGTLKRLPAGTQLIAGNPTVAGPWLDDLAKCDAVAHLAGEPVAARWTAKRRQRIRDSRVRSTELIAQALAKAPTRADGSPRALVSTSAVGYYGMYEDNPTEFIEDDPPGSGFLADVCVAWEGATKAAAAAGARVAIIRVGMVLANEGGALPPMARFFRWFLGGPVAGGRQWVSWIHVSDLAGLYLHALDRTDATGPINGTTPEPITNWGFSQTLAGVLRRPCWLRAPKLGLRVLLGQMSQLATHGQRAIPTRPKALGYEYRFPLLEPALRDLLT